MCLRMKEICNRKTELPLRNRFSQIKSIRSLPIQTRESWHRSDRSRRRWEVLFPTTALEWKSFSLHFPYLPSARLETTGAHTFWENCNETEWIRRGGVADDEVICFTDVMSVAGGQRTFFTYPGGSADFEYDDIDWSMVTLWRIKKERLSNGASWRLSFEVGNEARVIS